MSNITFVEGIASFSQHLEEIRSSAQHEVLVLDTAVYPEEEDSSVVELQLLSKGVPNRTIYDRTAIGVEGRMSAIEERIAAGEQARVTTQMLPIKLSIVDRRVAVMPASRSHPDQGVLVIREAFLVEALVTHFESLWERARPLSPGMNVQEAERARSHGLTQRDMLILDLLAAGTKDVSIARQLGTSPVTIRRRIRRLIKALGVETRFQAGMAATKRGWL